METKRNINLAHKKSRDGPKQVFRTILHPPYATTSWNVVTLNSQTLITATLSSLLSEILKLHTTDTNYHTSQKFAQVFKQYFFFGVNEVTAAIEHHQCHGILLNKNTETAYLIQHIPVMAALYGVRCIILNDEKMLSKMFKLRFFTALGFKMETLNSASEVEVADYIALESSATKAQKYFDELNRLVNENYVIPEVPFLMAHRGSEARDELLPARCSQVDCTPRFDIKHLRRKERRQLRRQHRRKKRTTEKKFHSVAVDVEHSGLQSDTSHIKS